MMIVPASIKSGAVLFRRSKLVCVSSRCKLLSMAARNELHPTRSLPTNATAVVGAAPKPAYSPGESRLIRRLWDAYSHSLHNNPLWTKVTMAAFIFFCSDSATQFMIPDQDARNNDGSFRWKASRALSGASFGVVATTWLHYWWGFLETFVGARIPVGQYRLANTLTKVVIDQAIGAPAYIYTYYVLTNFLQDMERFQSTDDAKKSWEEVNNKASEMLWPTMFRHWRVWPTVHSINFYFTPLHHRVLVQNTVLVGWSGYLSHLNHGGLIMTPDEEVKATIVRKETRVRLHTLKRASTALAVSPTGPRPDGASTSQISSVS